MRLDELFSVEYGNQLDMNKMKQVDPSVGVAFVGRLGGLTGKSGVAGYVKEVKNLDPYPSGLLTVALGGSLLSSYVQQQPFYTAQNVAVLKPLDPEMPILHRLYYAMCIRANAFRYSAFGREANRTLADLEMPASPPDWVDTKEIPTVEGLGRSELPRVAFEGAENWGEFEIGSLFDVLKGKRVTKADRRPGDTRFISASDSNNGVTDMCDLDPIFPANTLSVPYDGSIGFAFYQDKPYFALDSVQVLVPKEEGVSSLALLFAATMVRHERWRFSYGYKWHLKRMRSTKIKLPSTSSGEPDWDWMDRYMRGLPFSAALSYSTETPAGRSSSPSRRGGVPAGPLW